MTLRFYDPTTIALVGGGLLGGQLLSSLSRPSVPQGPSPAQAEQKEREAALEAARKERAEAGQRQGRQASLLGGGTQLQSQIGTERKSLLGT